MNRLVYQKLAKIAARTPPKEGYSAAILAHELGHAKDFEGRRSPNLRAAVEQGISIGCTTGAVIGAARGKPGLAALSAGLGEITTFIDEATAAYGALKALKRSKSFRPDELRKMRNHLIAAGSTYLGHAALKTGLAAGAAASVRYPTKYVHPALAIAIGGLTSVGVMRGLHGIFNRTGKGLPALTPTQGNRLKKQMGVAARMHTGKKDVGAYMPKYEGRFTRSMREQILDEMLSKDPSKDKKKTITRILGEGGVLIAPSKIGKKDLRRQWAGIKKTAEEKKRMSLAKELGLGLTTAGVATGIGALALGKKGRARVINFFKPIRPELQKTPASPWSTLGVAVAG